MVRLNDEDAKKYPSFDLYLRRDFVHVSGVPRIMKAYWKWSDFHESALTLAFFKYGWPPVISARAFECKYEDTYPSYTQKSTRAHFIGIDLAKTWSKDGINLLEGLVELAAGAVDRHDVGKGRDGDALILEVIEATILHEMVHWSYFYNDVDEQQRYKGDKEYGTRAFEQEAYGHLIQFVGPHGAPFCEEVIPPFLGVATKTVGGVCKVDEIKPGSPADKAGLKPGDVIATFDGQKVASDDDFTVLLVKKTPGDRISLGVRRGDTALTIAVVLAARAH